MAVDDLALPAALGAFVLDQVAIETGKAAEVRPQAGQSYSGSDSSSSRSVWGMGV